jgi:hypothetical protein
MEMTAEPVTVANLLNGGSHRCAVGAETGRLDDVSVFHAPHIGIMRGFALGV